MNYPDYLSNEQKVLVNKLLSQTEAPQALLNVVEWAECHGGAGKGMEIIAWVTYEYNLMSCDDEEDRAYIKYWISEWLKGNPMANRPDWAADGEGEYEFSFPVQASRFEQWLALHQLREIVIIDWAINRQTLLDAWAWRLHQTKSEIDVMTVFTKICDEFPVEAWRYPTTDIQNFRLPAGDWLPIIHDAKQWQHYRDTIHAPKIDMLCSTLREYEKVIADFDNVQDQQVTQYRQYLKEWEALTGKGWRRRH